MAHTLAPSYRAHATQESGKVAASALAEERKCEKHQGHFFTPVAIETLGAIGPKSLVFFRDLGRRIRAVTDEPKSTNCTCSKEFLWLSSVGTVLRCRAALAPDFIF